MYTMLHLLPFLLLLTPVNLGKGNPRGIGNENTILILDLEANRYARYLILENDSIQEIHDWKDLPGIDALVAPLVTVDEKGPRFFLHDGQQRLFWELGRDEVRKGQPSLELGWHNYLVAGERVAVGSWKFSEQIAFENGTRVQRLSEIMEKRSRDYFDYLVIQIPERREFLYMESGYVDRAWIYGLDGNLKRNLRLSGPTTFTLGSRQRLETNTLITISSGFIAGGMVFLNYQEDGYPLVSHVFDLNSGDHLFEREGQIIHMNPQGRLINIEENDGEFFLTTSTLNQ